MLSHTGTRVLETPRLVLRRFEEKDAEAMFAWAGDSQVTRFLRYATHKNVDDSRAVLRQWPSRKKKARALSAPSRSTS